MNTLIIITGILATLIAIMNADWFFNAQRGNLYVALMGRGAGRVAYGVSGAVVVLLGMTAI